MVTPYKISAIKSKITVDHLLFYVFLGGFLGLPLGTAPSNVCGGFATAIWIFSGRIVHVKNLYKKVWIWPVILLIILHWTGLLYTPEITKLSIKYARKTHYWLNCFVIAAISYKYFSPTRFTQAFLLGLAINALVAILQVSDLVPVRGTAGYTGLNSGYRALSTYLVLGILMASYFFKESKGRKTKILFSSLMLLFIWNLFMIKGRNGYFTFIVLSPLLIINIYKGVGFLRTAVIFLLCFVFLYFSPFAEKYILNHTIREIKSHMDADSSEAWGKKYSSKEERFFITRSAVIILLKNPIFGVGTGGFLQHSKEMGKAIAHPHNNFLYVAVSFGFVGVFTLAWIFWEVIKNSWHQRHTPVGFFVFAGSMVILVSGTFNTQILDTGTAFLFAVVVGLQNCFQDIKNYNSKNIMPETA